MVFERCNTLRSTRGEKNYNDNGKEAVYDDRTVSGGGSEEKKSNLIPDRRKKEEVRVMFPNTVNDVEKYSVVALARTHVCKMDVQQGGKEGDAGRSVILDGSRRRDDVEFAFKQDDVALHSVMEIESACVDGQGVGDIRGVRSGVIRVRMKDRRIKKTKKNARFITRRLVYASHTYNSHKECARAELIIMWLRALNRGRRNARTLFQSSSSSCAVSGQSNDRSLTGDICAR